jgi:hypothetical protein
MSAFWECSVGFGKHDEPNNEAMAFPRMGFGFYWGNSPIVLKGTSFHFGGHRVLHQVD